MSGSELNERVARAPRAVILAHPAIEFPYGVGGQSRFFSASSSRVASTYPASAAPKQGNPALMACSVIADDPQIGTLGGYFRPDAAQCTTSASRAVRTAPS